MLPGILSGVFELTEVREASELNMVDGPGPALGEEGEYAAELGEWGPGSWSASMLSGLIELAKPRMSASEGMSGMARYCWQSSNDEGSKGL